MGGGGWLGSKLKLKSHRNSLIGQHYLPPRWIKDVFKKRMNGNHTLLGFGINRAMRTRWLFVYGLMPLIDIRFFGRVVLVRSSDIGEKEKLSSWEYVRVSQNLKIVCKIYR